MAGIAGALEDVSFGVTDQLKCEVGQVYRRAAINFQFTAVTADHGDERVENIPIFAGSVNVP